MISTTPCNNSVFQWIYFIKSHENWVLTAFNAFLIPSTFIANLLVIISIVKTKQVQDGVNDMFICLSVSDCLVALICESAMMALLVAFRSERSCALELTVQYSSSFLCNFSGMMIVSIAISRYIQTRKTIKMRFDKNRSITTYLKVFSLLVAVIVVALDVLGTFMSDYAWINVGIQLAQLVVLITVCLLYIMTYYTVSKNRKQQDKILHPNEFNTEPSLNVKYVRRMIVTTIMILASILLSYFPLLIMGIYTVLKSTDADKSQISRKFKNYLSFQLGFTSSLLSAIIYLHRNKKCRAYIIKKLKLRKHGRNRIAHSSTLNDNHISMATIIHIKPKTSHM